MKNEEKVIEYFNKNPIALLQHHVKDIASSLNISVSTLFKIRKKHNITRQKAYEYLVDKYNPKRTSIFFIEHNNKTCKLNKKLMNKLARKKYKTNYIKDNDMAFLDLLEDIKYLEEKYPYFMLQLSRSEICEFLGVPSRKYYEIRDTKRWSKKDHLFKLIKDFPLNEYSYREIEEATGINQERLSKIVRKYGFKKKYKKAMSIKVIKARRLMYGTKPLKRKKISMKKIKEWFENRLKKNGKIHVREIKEELQRDDFSKMIYAIKNRHGLIDYYFDKSKLTYFIGNKK